MSSVSARTIGLNSSSEPRRLTRNGIFLAMWVTVCKCKKRTVASLFVLLEAISFVLDLYGKKERGFLLASFLLSVIGFAITIFSVCCIKERTRSEAGNRFMVVEIVFSSVQLVFTGIYLIMKILGVKISINASVFPLVFAIIVFIFALKKEALDRSPLLPVQDVTSNSPSTAAATTTTTTMRSDNSPEGTNSSLNFSSSPSTSRTTFEDVPPHTSSTPSSAMDNEMAPN
ncbi:hypothetical protein LWI29_020428 [Acer saccharum]|uniref:Uncharacterized protein n=1 Tax=Acer saccharum TaxID=4024 RepID=A0AA39STF2_ACESA|nr:hypothetical protein LWI29_020428 [Acer saccharum]KAK1582533.1 hypothetical protein Q3G72_016002 [Acer saccharum]